MELEMQINFAHLRQPAVSGGWVNFAVFDARSSGGTTSTHSVLLEQLTARARANQLRVDQSALAFNANGRIQFFGSKHLVAFLSRNGLPRWTHTLTV
jgi:predicted XRE-type DNA-binding protein